MEKYKDSHYPIHERLNSLINQMTLKEKVGQLNQKMYGWEAYNKTENGYELTSAFKEQVAKFDSMGALYGLFRADPWSNVNFANGIKVENSAAVTNMIQKYVKENTRLGIPVLFSEECPHGHQALDSTIFPTHIGSGASWNPQLQQMVSKHVADELHARGGHLGLVSTLDIVRDPRWGRTEECFSEDPFLSSKMTEAVVRGMQGENENTPKVLPVLKHFAAQGAGVGGHNSGPALIGERELREIFLPPMKAGVQSGVLACMAAYNEIDGVPCHANHHLLTKILREEWDYKGIVMADGTALDRLLLLTGNKELAAAYGLKAGVDLSLWDDVYMEIETAVKSGKIEEQLVDKAVSRVLYLKFKLGLFDETTTRSEGKASNVIGSRRAIETNVEMARQSIVLVENKNKILPISKRLKKIAVIGPNADNIYNLLGDYTPPQRRENVVTILDGIKSMVGKDTKVLYAKGCGIRDKDKSEFTTVKKMAKEADIVVLALGGTSAREFGMEFENNGAAKGFNETEMDCGENIDVANLELGGVQLDLVKEIHSTGTPIISVLIQGRPYSIPLLTQYCEAVLIGWYPGQQGGRAIAEVLFGDVNPNGKLPVSIPRSSMQLPVYYNYKDSGAKEDYFDMSGRALYPFGYGLSYTSFTYRFLSEENETITLKELHDSKQVTFYVEVKNIGEIDGYEVVQLYIKDMEATVTQRKKELKGFQKVWLKRNETKTITFSLGFDELAIWDIDMNFAIEPGSVKLMVGGSSHTVLEKKLIIEDRSHHLGMKGQMQE
ncbi:glycoside hydrolase family 3 N-terminal domain-containing protein [Metabacillus elymi]|uniref:Glycoside hydrolase family 3 C-terminal domain-containing protein n=1 Tax=Metabacillus elymi TaxID=2745198 RepID=A0ABX6S221_9BACI|nr:glycoside hydrolase family 3 N-terminal domain-containing protein [Metabacillus sp. KUDC1714]QNF27516.1 glycoside hydrolase family 3 C-terminal domain-containing protein [Metabacillus sp. KUDC1714]